VIAPNEFPDFLAWLPGSETVKIFEKTKKTKILEAADLIFTLDFNALHRVGGDMAVLADESAIYHD
jgi:phosphoesterase RecJ-like protein